MQYHPIIDLLNWMRIGKLYYEGTIYLLRCKHKSYHLIHKLSDPKRLIKIHNIVFEVVLRCEYLCEKYFIGTQ